MERILATVNINMGWGNDNPVLTISRNTDVPDLVSQFIRQYQLPSTAFDVIMDAIQAELNKQNIELSTLGRPSIENQPKPYKDTTQKIDVKNKSKKGTVTWDQVKSKKELPINRIQFPKKLTASPGCPENNKQIKPVKQAKISLMRTKSPTVRHGRSPACDQKRPGSPLTGINQSRTPLRQRQYTDQQHKIKTIQRSPQIHNEVLSNIFDWLTRNQPKTMKMMNPEYVSFTGVSPQALCILQDFFEALQQNEFMNMDKQYFIKRITQFNLHTRLANAF